ncbi:hypothetical protein GGI13_001230 [Coemansia sp. RSA 455]|nr:hypothetical protein GGI13_001230 [Coemansia sp. RSA 455]
MRADLPGLAGFTLFYRSDIDLQTLRSDILGRLGLAVDSGAVVLGPVLCYVLVTLVALQQERMTGAILNTVFRTITGKPLGKITVATRNGVGWMKLVDISDMVREWVQSLCNHITQGRGVEGLLELVMQCRNYYTSECPVDENSDRTDPTGEVAKRVLDNSSDCRLLLGLNDALNTDNFKALCKGLFATASIIKTSSHK